MAFNERKTTLFIYQLTLLMEQAKYFSLINKIK